MTQLHNFTIRSIDAGEMSIILDWAQAEGWNPGINDGDVFHAVDRQGFLVGELDAKPVSSVSVVRYGDDFGFLGFYLADRKGKYSSVLDFRTFHKVVSPG